MNAEFKFQAKSYFTGEGKSIKFCEDGIGWNRENEGNVRTLGKKILCFPEAGLYIFLLLLLLFEKLSISCGASVSFMLIVSGLCMS